ncbi:unnamed protein product [Durusdinium trenchii]|uniref:Uncharacterized protein n=1 Tax=Durusdinium trenchii TaxID=1381693 RepID=A0ABP0QP59_9DINO
MTQLEKLYLDETEIVGRLSSFSKLIRLEELFLRNTGVQGELSSLRKLRKLQKLYLGNTKVAGELSGLEKMTQLKYLELSNAKVAGDLSSLQGLSQLHGVFLSHTKVTGDLSGLQNLTQLKQFFLSGTDIVGDLSGLQGMLQLERIDLDNTQIGGDISSLQRIQMLHYLILDNTKVSGNVSCLHSLSRLEHLGLENTKVGGNLLSLHAFTRLRELMLSNTPITGELSNLQTCSQLQVLDLSGSYVAGDLSSLRSFQAQHLETLVLSNTEVQGDLSSLQTMTQLKVLDLGNSKVAGDLRGLRTITELTALDLTSTKVAGDLSHLKTAAQLRFLDLANTKVAGNLSSLHQLTELEKLYLDSTEVVGDLSSLQTLSELQELFLSSTEAAGDLSNLQKIKYLEYLVLDNTKVSGDLSGLQTMAFLESLDLRGTAISGDVSSLKTLTQLQHLYLANTEVVGDLSVILHWHHIKTVDLSHTSVSGQLTAHWRGHALELRTFKLSHSQAKFVPTNEDLLELRVYYTSSGPDFLSKAVLPQLNVLELSGCPLHSQIGDLLLPLSACPVLTSIKAANCGLFGVLPSLKLASAQVDGITWTTWESPLLQSLLTWDLSSNKLDHVEAIPGNVQVLMLAGNPALSFADGVLRKAVTAGVFLDLQNVTLTNSTEIEELLEERALTKTPELFSVNLEGGYSCYSIMSKSLHITPEKLLPQDLCRCSPGFEGTAVNCKKCPGNTFKRSYSGICKTCPEGSEPEGGISCRCTFGDMVERAGVYSCPECRAGQASNGTSDEIHSDHKSENCIPCHNSHLVCADPGMLLWLAPPEEGFARLKVNDTLALPCLPPKKSRCNSTSGKGSAHPECAKGYRGILCSDCAAHHYLSNKICEPCRSGDMLPDHWQVAVAISAALALAAPFALVFLTLALVWVRHKPRWPAIGPWKDQLLIQAPILLQTCQLWAVLALLMKGEGQQGDAILPNWDLPYIEVLQFSVASLKGALNLQCKFDGAMIRLGFGLMAPVAPVLVVLCCLGMEAIDHGFGIAAALKALTLFYVGGASSTFKLLSCQRVDGERVSLPNEFAFRKWLPHLRCHDPSLSLVDTMGYVSAFCYGVLVPCALAYLYARQHLALLPGKMMMAPSVKDGNDGALEIRLAELSSCSWEKMLVKDQEGTLKRRLVAASAAHIAVLIRGRALVQLKDGAAIVKPSAGASGRSTEAHTSGGSNEQLQVGDVLNFMGAELDTKGTIKCRELAEAMMDRCLLEEAEASERALAGSKNILFKYARCRSIYMEIIQKLVAVALVSVVGSENGLEMSLTIILLMAAASAMVQPFLLPQVNVLQCGCFLCLAFAALSFSYQNAWLSRVALAAPFLLSAVLALRPDSTEGLAARIWQQLKETTDLEDGKPVEVIAETYAFL